jgi:hypothetical protein
MPKHLSLTQLSIRRLGSRQFQRLASEVREAIA